MTNKIITKVVDDIYQTITSSGSQNIEVSDQTWAMIQTLQGLGDDTDGGNQVQEVKLIDDIPADSNYKGTFDIQNDDHVHKLNQQLISYISRAGKVSEAEAAKKAGEWLMKLTNGV